MIRGAMRALKNILGNGDANDEELHRITCGAECLLDPRPITYAFKSKSLLSQDGGHFAPDTLDNAGINPCRRWHCVQPMPSQLSKR